MLELNKGKFKLFTTYYKNSTHINQKQKQTPTREVNIGIYRKHDVKD